MKTSSSAMVLTACVIGLAASALTSHVVLSTRAYADSAVTVTAAVAETATPTIDVGAMGELTAPAESAPASAPGTAALTATGSPVAEGDLPAPDISTEEAIQLVKVGVQFFKDGSYALGVATLLLVLLWGLGKFVYPRVKGLLSDAVQKIVVAGGSFALIWGTAVAGGVAWYWGFIPAAVGSGIATAVWHAVQQKHADAA